jgi:hypothetical protein
MFDEEELAIDYYIHAYIRCVNKGAASAAATRKSKENGKMKAKAMHVPCHVGARQDPSDR